MLGNADLKSHRAKMDSWKNLLKLAWALETESKSGMFKTNCLSWTKPRWMEQACLETMGENCAILVPVIILLSEFLSPKVRSSSALGKLPSTSEFLGMKTPR